MGLDTIYTKQQTRQSREEQSKIYVYVEPFIVNRATTVRIGEGRIWPLPSAPSLNSPSLSV